MLIVALVLGLLGIFLQLSLSMLGFAGSGQPNPLGPTGDNFAKSVQPYAKVIGIVALVLGVLGALGAVMNLLSFSGLGIVMGLIGLLGAVVMIGLGLLVSNPASSGQLAGGAAAAAGQATSAFEPYRIPLSWAALIFAALGVVNIVLSLTMLA